MNMSGKKKFIRIAAEEEVHERTVGALGVSGSWKKITEQPSFSRSTIERGRNSVVIDVPATSWSLFLGSFGFVAIFLTCIIGGVIILSSDIPTNGQYNREDGKLVEAAVWTGTSTSGESLDLNSTKTYSVYVKEGTNITSISIIGDSNAEQYEEYVCPEADTPDDWLCDQTGMGWIWVGNIDNADCPCTMEMNATGEVIIIDDEIFPTGLWDYIPWMNCGMVLFGMVIFVLLGTTRCWSVMRARLEVKDDYLSINYRGFLGRKEGRWSIHEIQGIWYDGWRKAGKKNPPRQKWFSFSHKEEAMLKRKGVLDDSSFFENPLEEGCLYVSARDGRKFICLVGWPGEELLWIRHELRHALGLEGESGELLDD